MQNEEQRLNLYNLVLEHVEKNNDIEIKNILYKELNSIENEEEFKQKILLNRYFSNLLFRYRYRKQNSVLNVLPLLLVDGTAGDWFGCFIQFVYPFLKDNNVFEIVYRKEITA